MIYSGSILYNFDNSGAIKVYCIKGMTKRKIKFLKICDILLITTKRIFA